MLKYFMTHKFGVNEKKNATLNGKTELFFTSLRICSTKGKVDISTYIFISCTTFLILFFGIFEINKVGKKKLSSLGYLK